MRVSRVFAAAFLFLAALCGSAAQAVVLFNQTVGTSPTAVANTGPDLLGGMPPSNNCVSTEGCSEKRASSRTSSPATGRRADSRSLSR